jgi:single-strand DNA-binding protein
MSQFNKIILIGAVSSLIEKKRLNTGAEVISFTLRVERSAVEGVAPSADNFSVVCFDSISEATGLNPGQEVLVEGSIRNRQYDDNSGKRVYVTEIYARRLKIFSQSSYGSNSSVNEIPILEENPNNSKNTHRVDFNDAIQYKSDLSHVFDEQIETEDVPF